jgi:hypothetical protein
MSFPTNQIIFPAVKVASSGTSVPAFSPPAKVLVLGCIDPRFQSYLTWFLTHQRHLHGQFDLFTLAGASLGVNQAESVDEGGNELGGVQLSAAPPYSGVTWGDGTYKNSAPILRNWHNVFYGNLDLAVDLHQITDIWIFDHLDCAAYKIIKFNDSGASDLDIRAHSDEIIRLAIKLRQGNSYLGAINDNSAPFSGLNIKGFVINTSGDIFKVFGTNTGANFVAPGLNSYNTAPLSETCHESGWILPTILASLFLITLFYMSRPNN